MPTSSAMDIAELALRIELANTMSAINEKDLILLVNNDSRRGVSESGIFDWTEQG
jgi:hypothetical protein